MIKHITQTLKDNCLSACIAMLLGEDINKITEEFHTSYHANEISAASYLRKRKLIHQSLYTGTRVALLNKIYLLTVPSLNIEAGTHAILVDVIDTNTLKIYDPNKGRIGKKFYSTDSGDPLAVSLGGCELELFVEKDILLQWRNQHLSTISTIPNLVEDTYSGRSQ